VPPTTARLAAAAFALAVLLPPTMLGGTALAQADGEVLDRARRAFGSLPKKASPDPARVALGHYLFKDKRLSGKGNVSCASCHDFRVHAGTDGKRVPTGYPEWKGLTRNTPTVLNASLHKAQFWDGRSPSLAAQAATPIFNPQEMGMPSEEELEDRLREDEAVARAFQKAFPGQASPVNKGNVALAIAAFEETLVTPARFDQYLAGDAFALSPQARRGLKAFLDRGCVSCHDGPGVGGGQFQKFGVVKPYRGTSDVGRFRVTQRTADLYVFKVASLRNVTATAPYFHNGGIAKLDQAIQTMAQTQLGVTLLEGEIKDLEAFLESLRGEIPASLRLQPELP
jgi:cytochrome c peroxidase